MSVQEVLMLYKGEGKFKDSDFQKRQELYRKQNDKSNLTDKLSVKEQMELLEARKDEEQIGRFSSLNKMDELELTDDIKLEEVFLVTRELEIGDDSFEIYEVYDKDGSILLKTDKDRNIIVEEKLKQMYSPEQIAELENLVMTRMLRENPETGKFEDCVAVSDNIKNKENEIDEESIDKAEDSRDNTKYSKVKDKDDKDMLKDGEQLEEAQIEEKAGGKIVDVIQDPNFYQYIPFAKYRTFLVDEGGTLKFVDGQGNEIKGMEEQSRQAYVDDYTTERKEKQLADNVFSTGRNDNNTVIAIKNGKVNIVDIRKERSEQLDTAGHDTTDKQKGEVRDNITQRDISQDYGGASDITEDYLEEFLRKECRTLSQKQFDELYNYCISNNIRENDITLIREEINHILEEAEKDGRDMDRDREHERTIDDEASIREEMRRRAGLI